MVRWPTDEVISNYPLSWDWGAVQLYFLTFGSYVAMSHPLHTQHERKFDQNRFVYPVLSRRSGGMSVGVNLNPDKICNFDCIYCQVDRTVQSETRFVELDALLAELRSVLALVASGKIYETEKFGKTPPELRRLNDIAFSGDGEPTTYKNFDEIIAACAEVKREAGLNDVKMVLITNASMFHRPHVKRGLRLLDANQGEIWAKLDAGTDEYYQQIERTPVPFQQILDNLTDAARVRPIVIQSLFMQVAGEPPSQQELESWCDRLCEIVAAGGRLRLVQVTTIARRPAESKVTPLPDSAVDAIAQLVRDRVDVASLSFHGTSEY